MKLGLGITTTPNRRELLDKCIEMHSAYSSYARIYVNNDVNFDGVAASKNKCLEALKDCDYIFLFDDDCFPYMRGWEDELIKAHERTGQNHFLLLDNKTHQPFAKPFNRVTAYKECGGVFMSFTKRVVHECGYFDLRYKGHGFEHAGYSQRIYHSGLNEHPYMMPDYLNDYLQALDYSGNTKSSVTPDQKQQYYQHNRAIFMEEAQGKTVINKTI